MDRRLAMLETTLNTLVGKNAELDRRNAELDGRNVELDRRNAELDGRNAELDRKSENQAAEILQLKTSVDMGRQKQAEFQNRVLLSQVGV